MSPVPDVPAGATLDMKPAPEKASLRVLPDDLVQPSVPGAGVPAWGTWRDLLWAEWFIHSRLLLSFLLAWLAVVWLLPLVAHPLWILALGPVYALVAGPAFGGSDVIHGCEEFSFSLPAPRRARLAARLAVGAGGLVVLSAMNMLALEGNLSDVLVRVFVSSGLPPVQLNQPWLLYGLVLAVPFAVFALGFSLAALATSRTVALTAWLWGILGALTVLRGGAQLEEQKWDRLTGSIAVPLLVGVATASLWVAGRLYGRKEAVTNAVPWRMPPSWWLGLALLLAAGLGVAVLAGWFITNFSRLL